MSVIPCQKHRELQKQAEAYAKALLHEAHTIGNHGMDKQTFANSGIFRAAIEKLRGQFSATMAPKRAFVKTLLDHMKTQKAIGDWQSAGEFRDRGLFQFFAN